MQKEKYLMYAAKRTAKKQYAYCLDKCKKENLIKGVVVHDQVVDIPLEKKNFQWLQVLKYRLTFKNTVERQMTC